MTIFEKIWAQILDLFGKTTKDRVPVDWSIVGTWAGKPVRVRTDTNYGGGFWSITWGTKEFLLLNKDGTGCGHGGQLQTAYQAGGKAGDWNPTECGSQADGNAKYSSTQILAISRPAGNVLKTKIHPAFWRPVNGKVCTNDILEKTVTLSANIIRSEIAITFAEAHQNLQLEGLCCYAAPEFFYWMTFDPATGEFKHVDTPPIPTGPGVVSNDTEWRPEWAASIPFSDLPVIAISAYDGTAIGCYCPDMGSRYMYGWGLAGWPKWDAGYVVLPVVNAGDTLRYTVYTAFGTTEDVQQALRSLAP